MTDKNFVFWCQKTIPLVFDNSMSYYECLCKLLNYVNSLTNDVAEIARLQEELQNYVDNYFTNLDIQEEINNKLDKMAEDGELESIIGAYINANVVLGFNTITDLKSSENLINGSFCRTFGLNTLNDGGSSLYKIRNITSSDVVDNMNIIALEKSDELIAEKIQEELPKNYVFIGDSYLQGFTPEGEVESWGKKIVKLLNLPNNSYKIIAKGGTTMNADNENNFYNLIKNEPLDNKVTDVILCAGYNDRQKIGTESSILLGMTNFYNKIKEIYPNATLKIGFIGNTSIVNDKYGVSSKCPFYINSCKKLGIEYLNNIEYALHNYSTEFSSDGIHPNDEGQEIIANTLYQILKMGYGTVIRERQESINGENYFYMEQQNDKINFICQNYLYYEFDEPKNITMSGGNYLLINKPFNNSLAIGSGSTQLSNSTTLPIILQNNEDKYITVNCRITIDNNLLLIYPIATNSEGTAYLIDTIKAVQIRPFMFTLPALYN